MSCQVYFDNSKETQAIEQCPLQQDLQHVATAGVGEHHQSNHAALPQAALRHGGSAAHQPPVADAADCVPKQATKPSLINAEGARPRSSSSKHHR